MILRILFWLLLAMNGVLFALGRGFADARTQRTEPQRLVRQLHPEQLVLAQATTPSAPSDAKARAAAINSTPAPAPVAAATQAAASTTTPVATPVATSPPPVTAPAAAPTIYAEPQAAVAAPVTAPAAATSAPAKPAAPEKLLACVAIGNFDPNEPLKFRGWLAAAKLLVSSQSNVREVASYMVYIAADDGREAAERRNCAAWA